MPPTVDDVRSLVATAPDVVAAIYVFGSVASSTAGATSDLDIGVLLRTRPTHTLEGRLLDYEAELERVARCPVQVVILNDAPPDLVSRVLRHGHVVLDRDRALRIRFEVRARNLYFDLLPFLTRYRRRARELAASRT